MNTSVTFRHLDSSEPLKKHALEKLEHIQKYLDGSAQAHVVLSAGKHSNRADIQISSHGMMIRGKEDSGDMYNSIERAVEKIEIQIKRYKERLKNHKPHGGAKRLRVKFATLGSQESGNSEPQVPRNIVETKEVEARPMAIDEACMQMDLLGSDLLVFLNAKTEHMNILYRKKGQKYGLIETL
ncbi:MAG: ribosome-associated translation inhibitor RaiA [Deltaproteobacteria bacterium]|nr:ribosome-associated translation inhibitor RaiA [Deltaproteobacteria bacterium]